jgi:hypothetical protein
VNKFIEDTSNKSVEELNNMKLVIPKTIGASSSKEELSTQQTSYDEELIIPVQ